RRHAVVEMAERHEDEIVDAEAEGEVETDGTAEIGEAEARTVTGRGRQWRPAAVIVVISPGNPGWSPDRVGRPAPAPVPIVEPAAIMKRRPAPGIIRDPAPAAIGVGPMAVITIGRPAGIHGHGGRPPAGAIARDINPVSVRR